MIHFFNRGHPGDFFMTAGAPDREDGAHAVDAFRPLYEGKDWSGEQRERFFAQFEEVDRSLTAPVIWYRQRADWVEDRG